MTARYVTVASDDGESILIHCRLRTANFTNGTLAVSRTLLYDSLFNSL